MTTEAAGGALGGGEGRRGHRQPHFQSRFRSGADRALRVVPAGRVSKGTASVCTWLSAASMSSNNQRQQHVGASCPGPPGGVPGTGGTARLPLAGVGMLRGRVRARPTQARHTLRVKE